MKTLLIAIITLFSISLQAQSSFTVLKSSVATSEVLNISADAEVTLVPTRGTQLRVEATVLVATHNSSVVKVIKESNRHDIVVDGESITYTKPKTLVRVKGETIEEVVNLKVYVPESIQVVNK